MSTLRTPLAFALAASFLFAACKSGQDGAKATVQTDSTKSAASAGDMRMDPNKVVLSWSGGQMTYGELYKKHEGEFKKLKNKYESEVYAAEQQNLEAYIIQLL